MSKPGEELLLTDANSPPDMPQDALVGQESGSSQAGQKLSQVAHPVAAKVFTMT